MGPLHHMLGRPAGVARWTNACQAGLLARKPPDAEPVWGWWAVAVGRGISPGLPATRSQGEAVRSILQWNCGGGTPLLSWWESLIQNWGSLEASELTSCEGFSVEGVPCPLPATLPAQTQSSGACRESPSAAHSPGHVGAVRLHHRAPGAAD